MIKEYGEFHLSLRRLARRQYITVAAFPIPPEDENTRGVKLPPFHLTHSLFIGTTFHTFMHILATPSLEIKSGLHGPGKF